MNDGPRGLVRKIKGLDIWMAGCAGLQSCWWGAMARNLPDANDLARAHIRDVHQEDA